MDAKLKHLEFLQNVITRMNSNSFLVKGWTITLISALFALAAKEANIRFVIISYIIIPAFWVLDGFFLSVERQYRELYKHVAVEEVSKIDFNMDASAYKKGNRTWLGGIFSGTLALFYGISLAATIAVMYFLL